MATMKSAVFHGKCDIRVEEREIPSVGPEEVLIKVMACGVCGSDVHIFEGDQGSTTTVPPLIQGHEFAGIITEVGENVKDWKVGDHVCADPADNCNECYYCLNGLMSHCDHMRAIGTNVDGGFSQYCKVKARLLHRLKDDVTFVEGAMAEPLACCINGADRSDIKVGDNVVVYGGGAIGLLLMQLAKLQGASQVILVEPVEEKRRMAEKIGASFTIDPVHQDVIKTLRGKRSGSRTLCDRDLRKEGYLRAGHGCGGQARNGRTVRGNRSGRFHPASHLQAVPEGTDGEGFLLQPV